MPQHRAAFLDAKGQAFRAGPIDTEEPGEGQVQIRNKAIAINPVDWKVQESGYFVESFPAVLGEDLAGTIEAVGYGVTRFKPGDRVIGHSRFLVTKKNEEGTFQELVIVPEASVAKIPDEMEFEDAAVLPLALSTASAALYQPVAATCLGLDLPSTSPKKGGKTLLIWGGSSSVGAVGIQLAVASGLTVATTCSKRNFGMVEKLGAVPFDYNSPSVVGDLMEELRKGEFTGAYDAIGTRESSMHCGQIVAQFGGGVLASVLPPPEDLSATVRSAQVFAPSIFLGDNSFVGKGVWQDFVPSALASGQLVSAPPAEVVGSGIEAIQDACKTLKAGVSAKKIVVTL